jgi:hypothetical protein
MFKKENMYKAGISVPGGEGDERSVDSKKSDIVKIVQLKANICVSLNGGIRLEVPRSMAFSLLDELKGVQKKRCTI